MRSLFLYSFTSSLLLLGSSATFAETMDEAVRKAITNHPAVERAAISADVARQDINEQRSEFFPKVSTSLTGGRLYGDNATSRGLNVTRGAGYSWLWEGNAAVNQMLYDWNKTSDRVDAAEAERMSALYSYDDAKDSIAFQTVQAYIALHKAQVLYDEAQAYLRSMNEYRSRINKLVDGGGADEAEGSRARDLVLGAENVIASLKGQLSAAEANYKEVVGELPTTQLEKPQVPFMIGDDYDLEALIEKIQAHHPQIKAAMEQIESQEYNISADQKDVLPQLGSEFSYTKKDQDDVIGGESVDARAIVRMTWNLDTGGAQFARAKKAKLQKDQTLTQVEELRRSLERSLRISTAGLDMAVEQRDIQKKRYDELVTTLDTYKKQFEASQKKLLEVATTESQVFSAQNDYLASEYSVLDAAYGFLASQGDLNDAIDILMVMENDSDQKMAQKMAQKKTMIQTATVQNVDEVVAQRPVNVAEFAPYSKDDVSDSEMRVASLKAAREQKPASFDVQEDIALVSSSPSQSQSIAWETENVRAKESLSNVQMSPVMDDVDAPVIRSASLVEPSADDNISKISMVDDRIQDLADETVMNDRFLANELEEVTASDIDQVINQSEEIEYQPITEVEIGQDQGSNIEFVPFATHMNDSSTAP